MDKNSTKIAYFMDVSSLLGGAGNHLLRHAMISKRLGLPYIVVLPEESGEEVVAQRCKEYKLDYIYLKYKTSFDFMGIDIIAVKQNIGEIVKFIEDENITLVHSVQLNPTVEMAARIKVIPHLMSIYQLEEQKFYIEYPDIFAKYIHCDSQLYCKIWEDGLKIKGFCIRSWIPEEVFVPNDVNKNEIKENINILVSGAICERKNQLKAIRILNKLLDKGVNATMTLCGQIFNDETYVSCKKYIEEHNLSQYVNFTGFVHNVQDYMKKAQVLLCVSDDESFPQVILEALSMGISVVTTPVAGVPELIKHKHNGYVGIGFDIEDIYEVFMEFYKDYLQDNTTYIIKNAHQTFQLESSFQAVSNKLLAVYKYMQEEDKKDNQLIDIDKIAEELNNNIVYLEKNKEIICNYKFISEHIFYIAYLYKHLLKTFGSKEEIKVIIWGASKGGELVKEIIERFYSKVKIEYYIDKFRTGDINNVKILSKDELDISEIDFIFIATTPGKKEAIQYLEEKGLRLNLEYTYFI